MVMILMRPSERSKLLAYVEELGETDRVTQGGTSVHNNNNGGGNQTFESESAAPPSQSAQKQEQSIEMQEMQYIGKKGPSDKVKLDQNKVKSDDFFEVEINQEENKED